MSNEGGNVMRITIASALAVAVAAALASSVSAGPNITAVAGYGKLASGLSATVGAVSTPAGVHGRVRVVTQPGFVFVSRVTCVKFVGARVLVGGVIVRSSNPATVGHTSLVAIENGGPGGTDLLGSAFSTSGLDTCPVFAVPMNPVTVGNFVVV
jgi:hypothetical protein